MGELAIHSPGSEKEARAFTRAVVHDIKALDALIARDGIERGITRMGVEQEMYLVGADRFVAPCATQVLERLSDPRFTTELARFNLEANLDPCVLGGPFLATMEEKLDEVLATVDAAAESFGARVLLTGILPTLRPADITHRNITPLKRYELLNDALFGRGPMDILIDGVDQYHGRHDSVVLEGANTSLQLHLQVTPETSAGLYNLMQLITAPLLAAAVNSPVLLGRRLWRETRVAVFERALDSRTDAQLSRDALTRVSFGQNWVEGSIVEIFRDNVARFPSILTRDLGEDSLETVARGEAPKLAALCLHNGTVWRWNRPCYGVADGVAHLRIENRVLPAGPTVVDEVANAALFYGMMVALPDRYGDVAKRLPFDDAKTNFLATAHQGLTAELTWLDGRRIGAKQLLLEELIPAARDGLEAVDVPGEQIERYLGVVRARVEHGRTGAAWLLQSYQAHHGRHAPENVWRGAVSAMLEGQRSGRPVHEWPQAEPWVESGPQAPTVSAIMTRDVFTVRPDDVIDLAGGVMEWKSIRHVPVEDRDGKLVGILTARDLLGARGPLAHSPEGGDGGAGTRPSDDPPVAALMDANFTTVPADTDVRDAVPLMLASQHGALLVVNGSKLVGIVTERDLLRCLAERLASEA